MVISKTAANIFRLHDPNKSELRRIEKTFSWLFPGFSKLYTPIYMSAS